MVSSSGLAPLRKVVNWGKPFLTNVVFTSSRGTAMIRYHYVYRPRLECGHRLEVDFSAPRRERKRCKRCCVLKAVP